MGETVVIRTIGASVPVGVIVSVPGVGPVANWVTVVGGTVVTRTNGGSIPVGMTVSVPGVGPVAI